MNGDFHHVTYRSMQAAIQQLQKEVAELREKVAELEKPRPNYGLSPLESVWQSFQQLEAIDKARMKQLQAGSPSISEASVKKLREAWEARFVGVPTAKLPSGFDVAEPLRAALKAAVPGVAWLAAGEIFDIGCPSFTDGSLFAVRLRVAGYSIAGRWRSNDERVMILESDVTPLLEGEWKLYDGFLVSKTPRQKIEFATPKVELTLYKTKPPEVEASYLCDKGGDFVNCTCGEFELSAPAATTYSYHICGTMIHRVGEGTQCSPNGVLTHNNSLFSPLSDNQKRLTATRSSYFKRNFHGKGTPSLALSAAAYADPNLAEKMKAKPEKCTHPAIHGNSIIGDFAHCAACNAKVAKCCCRYVYIGVEEEEFVYDGIRHRIVGGCEASIVNPEGEREADVSEAAAYFGRDPAKVADRDSDILDPPSVTFSSEIVDCEPTDCMVFVNGERIPGGKCGCGKAWIPESQGSFIKADDAGQDIKHVIGGECLPIFCAKSTDPASETEPSQSVFTVMLKCGCKFERREADAAYTHLAKCDIRFTKCEMDQKRLDELWEKRHNPVAVGCMWATSPALSEVTTLTGAHHGLERRGAEAGGEDAGLQK